MEKVKNKGGRPSLFKQELWDAVLEELIEDKKPLSQICAEKGIKTITFYRWMVGDKPEAKKRKAQYDAVRDFLDDILEEEAKFESRNERPTKVISQTKDKKTGDEVTTVTQQDNVSRSRLISDTYLRIVARRKGALMRIAGKDGGAIQLEQKSILNDKQKAMLDKILDENF